jgi:hypothetical protein
MDPSRYSFILHIWFEGQAYPFGQQRSLRGSLQQVESDQLFYFVTLERLTQLLAHITGWQDAENTSEPSPDTDKYRKENIS